jgi:hypothetical protein
MVTALVVALAAPIPATAPLFAESSRGARGSRQGQPSARLTSGASPAGPQPSARLTSGASRAGVTRLSSIRSAPTNVPSARKASPNPVIAPE